MFYKKVLHENKIETSHIFNVGDNIDIADNQIIMVEDKREKHSPNLSGSGGRKSSKEDDR